MLLNTLPHLVIASQRCRHKQHRLTQLLGKLKGKTTFATTSTTSYQDVYLPHPP